LNLPTDFTAVSLSKYQKAREKRPREALPAWFLGEFFDLGSRSLPHSTAMISQRKDA
jgi:hypothetical protein